jgi:fructose PTS system EIIBC or EIIC component
VAGSAVAAVIAMVGGVGDHAPHGGPIVLPVVDRKLMYLAAILTGTLVTAISSILLKARARKKMTERGREAA